MVKKEYMSLKINKLQISKLNLFELVTPKKNLNMETYLN